MLSDCAVFELAPALPAYELLAVAGASHAFVVCSKSLNQCACRTRREKTAAKWRNSKLQINASASEIPCAISVESASLAIFSLAAIN